MEDLSIFLTNIIKWYPINDDDEILEIDCDKAIVDYLKNNSKMLTSSKIDNLNNIDSKFDKVVIIGKSSLKIFDNLETVKRLLKDDKSKLLMAFPNKYGMKYFAGDGFEEEETSYTSITSQESGLLSYFSVKEKLDEAGLKYKFYYPMPDYKLTNVIYSDKLLPDSDSVDARILTYCKDGKILNFSEREAFKVALNENKELFKFFANSFFVEVSKNESFEDIKYVSYGITRKAKYRIRTVVRENNVLKYSNQDESKEHIEKIRKNIEILEKNNITTVDKYVPNYVDSKYLPGRKTFDEVLMEEYNSNGIDSTIKLMNEFKTEILEKFEKCENTAKTVFEKYNVDISLKLKDKMHFIKDGLIDLIFQNCLVKDGVKYIYDQEWYEENVPVEFIMYRCIKYFTELTQKESIDKLYTELNIHEFIDCFEKLENIIQDEIKDEDMWNLHVDSTKYIGNQEQALHDYKVELDKYKEHSKELEATLEEYKKGVDDLTNLVKQKDVELVNYANQLRAISGSLSWKITKPIRMLSWILNPFNGASFIDRIYPPGGRRRAQYDKKQTEKKYAKRVKNYYRCTDPETAKYWEGIDHRNNVLYAKDMERYASNQMTDDYEKWIFNNRPTDQEVEAQSKVKFNYMPKFSIVIPLYNTNIDFFRELLHTIHNQSYLNWELCLADGSDEKLTQIEEMVKKDKRIKYKFLGENKGISDNTNEAINMSTGDFIVFVDHDDMLDITSLYEVAKAINENKDVDLVYSDEDKFHYIDEPRFHPNFKPDFAPDTLRSLNYICHLMVIRKSLLNEVGLLNSEYNGAQDFDMVLRASEKARNIVHIPKILYHWRISKDSTALNQGIKPYTIEAGRKAIEAHLKRIGLKGEVKDGIAPGTYAVNYEVKDNPKVSILIPSKDGREILRTCIDSILEKTTYDNYEIVIIENNSETQEIFDYYESLKDNSKIKVVYYEDKGFNYSKIINFGVKNSTGDYIIQLNNDIELMTPDWLEKMIGFCQRDDVGAVGVKLLYPDRSIQHAGVTIGVFEVAAHMFRFLKEDEEGYFRRENWIQNMSAVTAACIMTKKAIYEEVGYMDESFAVAFNDIDFCLKIRDKGYLIVYNPTVQMIHYESKTRGYEDTPEKQQRFKGEIDKFKEKWNKVLEEGDMYYNKNLRLDSDQYDIRTDKVI